MAFGHRYLRDYLKENPGFGRHISADSTESAMSFGLWSSLSSVSSNNTIEQFFELELTEALLEDVPTFVEGVNLSFLIGALSRYIRDEDVQRRINELRDEKEKATKLLEYVQRLGPKSHPYNVFRSLIAGAYPLLFRSAVKRIPTREEADYFPQAYQKFMKKQLRQRMLANDAQEQQQNGVKKQQESYVKLKIVKRGAASQNGVNSEPKEHGTNKATEGLEEEIDLSDFVKRDTGPVLKGKKLLIKGKGGVGKTTTVGYLTELWLNDNWDPDYTLVILVNMRKWMNTKYEKETKSAFEILTNIGASLSLEDEFFLSAWLNNWSRNVMVFMDSVDEIEHFTNNLSPTVDIFDVNKKATPVDVFLNILHGKLLPEATVLYTSRDFKGLNQLPCDGIAEIKGFDDHGVESYVGETFKKVPEDGRMVKKALKKHGVAKSMCSLPFHCKEICKILQESPASISEEIETRTRLTALIITKHLQRNLTDAGKKASTLDEKMRSIYFLRLAHLAYDGLFHVKKSSNLPKLVFQEADLKAANLTAENLEQALNDNLLVSTQNTGDAMELTFQFTHHTFQEMLAMALFIGRYSYLKDERKRIFEELSDADDGRFTSAKLFMYGLAYDKDSHVVSRMKDAFIDFDQNDQHEMKLQEKKTYKRLHEALRDLCKDARERQIDKHKDAHEQKHHSRKDEKGTQQQGHLLLQAAEIANECRSKDIEQEVNRALFMKNTSLVLSDVNIESVDMLGLVAVIGQPISMHTISISNAYLDQHAMRVLSQFLTDSQTVEELSLCGTGAEGLESFGMMLSVNKSIKNLRLERNGLKDSHIQKLHTGLEKLQGLRVLSLSTNKITEDGLSVLAQSLDKNVQLTELYLDDNDITDEAKKAINKCLCKKARLRIFSLRMNTLSDDSAFDIADVIRKCKYLEHVDLSHNQFGTAGAKVMVKELRRKTILDLSVNQIAVHELKEVKNVLVYGNTFGKRRVQIVTQSITNGSTFKILNLEGIHLNDESLLTVAEALVGNPTLVELKLANNSLTRRSIKVLNQVAFTCPKLKRIEVSKNYLDKIVIESLRDITHYTQKGLSELASTDERSLKKAKKTQLVAVKLVDITPGQMISIDKTKLDAMRLTVLDLTDAKLTRATIDHLSSSLEANVGLMKMELANCKLSTGDVESICQLLCRGTKLLHLGLSSNNIIDEAIYFIIQVFERNQYLRSLNLSNNSIGVTGIALLFGASEMNGKLEILDLSGNHISEAQRSAFGDAMQKKQRLKNIKLGSCADPSGASHVIELVRKKSELSYLDISGNKISSSLAKDLGQALKFNETIKILDLSDNRLGRAGVEALSEGLSGSSNLVSLKLRKNGLGEAGAEIVGNRILRLNRIACLDISENGIASQGLEALEPGLWDNRSLVSLNLSNNMIGDKGAKYLETSLKDKPNLTSLNLSSNLLLAAGARSIAHILTSKSTKIAYLDMTDNGISDRGVHYLVEAILKNSSLVELTLTKNSINVDGAKELLRGLSKNKVMTTLDLAENWLDDNAMGYVAELIKCNNALTSLNLANNSIGDEGAESLVQALRSGRSPMVLDWTKNQGISERANEALHIAFLGKKS